jgi:hypothetical protein
MVLAKVGSHKKIDIVIDDGSHQCLDQIKSFEAVFPHIDTDGVYIVEDVHTSYRRQYGGGLYDQGSFIEYIKRYIDDLHHLEWGAPRNDFWRSIDSINFHQNLVIVKKTGVNRDGPHTTGIKKIW